MVSAISLSPPKKSLVKLNTNGAVSYISNYASIRGMFRNVDATWLCRFSMALVRKQFFKLKCVSCLKDCAYYGRKNSDS